MLKVKNEVKAKTEESKKKVALVISEIESGFSIPPNERESKYEFGLSDLAEKQSRFIGATADLPITKLKLALRNAIDKERAGREYKQNFVMRDAEKDGIEGVRVFCVNMQDKPMRKNAKVAA